MISKNTLKFIKSLQQKKFRKLERAFFVEGSKNVTEILKSDFKVTHLLATEKYISEHHGLMSQLDVEILEASPKELAAAGTFLTNDAALAVAELKEERPFEVGTEELVLALDDIRDPGNMGTIIRIADWYGISKMVFSSQSADFYNPKVLNASMGSFSRVQFFYAPLEEYLKTQSAPIFGAYLDGESVHTASFEPTGILLMGNESQGISAELEPLVTKKVTIPSFGGAESLNVATATAVLCDNFRRIKK
ncbi:RNA methyltransferase [Echinicola pacifica]|uniref:RNA methyltransferase n=1 Tax=Echinicola pacifica TaxID=346377 RepID=A0A918Q2I7_9BACT|nr:RNA methyltransferase [Echinicola pacifica]GGZ31428.1 RNA methyltransferase [Echinicola pacifica]